MHPTSECTQSKHARTRKNTYKNASHSSQLLPDSTSKMPNEVPDDIIALAHSPIDLSSPHTVRLAQAKAWLKVYPTETARSIARLYDLNENSFKSSLRRDTAVNRHRIGSLNRVLSLGQERAIHSFIRSLLQFSILPTHALLYNAICGLKPKGKKPSYSWFEKWFKKAGLHKIKTKPIAIVRVTAAQISEVERWFQAYRETLWKFKIKKKNIYNFDEAGFRVGCARGKEILVPLDIREVLLAFKYI